MSTIKRGMSQSLRDFGPECECHNNKPRDDGTTLCGLPSVQVYKGAQMCRGHYDLAILRDGSVANTTAEAKAWLRERGSQKRPEETWSEFAARSVGGWTQKMPSRHWAYVLKDMHESGERLSEIQQRFYQEALAVKRVEKLPEMEPA